MSRHRKESNGVVADILLFLAIMGAAILVGAFAVLLMVHT